MNDMRIDDISRDTVTELLTTPTDLLHKHGDICTRLHFNKMSIMDIDTFIQKVVPTIKDSKDRLYVVRDLDNSRVDLILDNSVLQYDLTNIEDCRLSDILDSLATKQKIYYNRIPYSVVAEIQTDDIQQITVRVPSGPTLFRSSYYTGTIYTPPVWFKVEIAGESAVQEAGVFVVPSEDPDTPLLKTRLYRWPLPNVHYSGRICFGTTRFSHVGQDITDLSQVVTATIRRFFDSTYNEDLAVYSMENMEMLQNTLQTMHRVGVQTNARARDAAFAAHPTPGQSLLITVLDILSAPSGYAYLNYIPSDIAAGDFLRTQLKLEE